MGNVWVFILFCQVTYWFQTILIGRHVLEKMSVISHGTNFNKIRLKPRKLSQGKLVSALFIDGIRGLFSFKKKKKYLTTYLNDTFGDDLVLGMSE